jgi:secreted PhoX family phosphatase
MTTLDRRSFLGRGALLAGGGLLSATALERLTARSAHAQSRPKRKGGADGEGYGRLQRVRDQRGREILALPAGFSYVTFGDIGSTMSDGNPTPLALDGMAAFPGPDGAVRLIRNHEDRNRPGAGSVRGDASKRYDPQGGGGTTTLDYDPASRQLVRDFISLNGTIVNCAGGYGLGTRSWITAEETIAGPGNALPEFRFPKRHGYCFEVPLERGPNSLEVAQPIKAMGRFAHEALATDQRTGIVYLTEDAGSGRGSGFYRFLPRDPRNLLAGGKLEMLAIRGRPRYDAREDQRPNRRLPVTWVEIPEVDPEYRNEDDPRGVFQQGFRRGGTMFNRLEGCWYDEGSVFFVSTSGGDEKNGDVNEDGYREGYGQVWEYRPRGNSGGQLSLVYESPGGEELDSPDNLTVTPRGGLVLCEDDASSADEDRHPLAPGIENVNRLIGLSPEGDAFELAVNILNDSEFAGACYSPDGATLFVNVFGESETTPNGNAGMTCAITGPWQEGPL